MKKFVLISVFLACFASSANANQFTCTANGQQYGNNIQINLTNCNYHIQQNQFYNHGYYNTPVYTYQTYNPPVQNQIKYNYDTNYYPPSNPQIVKKWTLAKGENFLQKMGFSTSGKSWLRDEKKVDNILNQLGLTYSDMTRLPIGFSWCLYDDDTYRQC